jgi:ATP-dependent Clp protease ATP-binding subunit ClpA
VSPGPLAGTPCRVFDTFSEDARHALVLAADEARNLGHDRIGTEHLLLGLVRLNDASTRHLGLTLASTRQDVRAVLGATGSRTLGELRFTPTAKRALERADAATNGGRAGPSELLAALLGEQGSGAAELLATGAAPPPQEQARDDGDDLLALASRRGSVTVRALAALGVDEARLRRAVEDVRRR